MNLYALDLLDRSNADVPILEEYQLLRVGKSTYIHMLLQIKAIVDNKSIIFSLVTIPDRDPFSTAVVTLTLLTLVLLAGGADYP